MGVNAQYTPTFVSADLTSSLRIRIALGYYSALLESSILLTIYFIYNNLINSTVTLSVTF